MSQQESKCRPTITLMVGLPRSGKTTYVKMHKRQEVVVSADRLRYLVYNQRFWAGGERLMWSIHNIILRMLMEQQLDIIEDETNYTVESRAGIIKLAREYGYQVVCIVIATSMESCIQRAESEEYPRIIPFIKRLSQQYQPPSTEEGIDKIIYEQI